MSVVGVDGRTYKDQASADKAAARMANAPDIGTQKTTTSATTTQTTPTNTTTTSGNGWGESNYKDSDGYYSGTERNMATGGSEFGVITPTKATTTPKTDTSGSNTDAGAKIRQARDSLDYNAQQERLKNNPQLQETLNYWGATNKQPEQEIVKSGTTKTEETTTPKDRWDYSDNSPERMSQIAANVDGFSITNPELFDSESAFYNFFIAGKNRTPEQEKFLLDYYKNRKMYNEYDNYTSEAVGGMMAYGKVPENYLNYVKNSNPQRYAEIMDAKDKEQDKIKNDSYYSSILEQAGFDDTDNLAWQKREGLLVDENNDLIDDRRYHEPTPEERQKVDRINEIDGRIMEINNAVKHAEEDLTAKYPGASKQTIMALAQDRCSTLLREKEDLTVERTELAGTVDYLQNERQQQDKAGADTITQLQKNLGMYYEYTPEGISALLNAQYEAANPSLTSAENGTETEKRRALDSVLSEYYDKYSSIIERPKEQVINDVIAYANKNGVTLEQALQENFVKYLKQKPGYDQLNSITNNPEVVKIGDNVYGYWDKNGKLVTIGGSTGTGASIGSLYGFTDYTPISTDKKESTLDNFMSTHQLNSDGGECGSFVNDYLEALGYGRLYTDPIDKKRAVTNSDTATVGSIAVMDSKKYPQNGHTAIVTEINGDKVKLLESNWNDDHLVHERWVNKSEILGYFDPSKQPANSQLYNPELQDIFSKYSEVSGDSLAEKRFWDQWGKTISESGTSEKDFLKQYNEWYQDTTKDVYLEILANLDHLIELTGEEFDQGERIAAQLGIGDVGKLFDFIRQNQTVTGLADAKAKGLKLGVLSDSDVRMIRDASTLLGTTLTQETWNNSLKQFRDQILSKNKYLSDRYKVQSAYSSNKGFKYDEGNKAWKVGTKKTDTNNSSKQQAQATTTKTAKSIKNLGK